jgi:hypothetical protein
MIFAAPEPVLSLRFDADFAASVGSPSLWLSATASFVKRRTVAGLMVIPSRSSIVAIVLSARFQTRLDCTEPLPSPEADQHAVLFGTNSLLLPVGRNVIPKVMGDAPSRLRAPLEDVQVLATACVRVASVLKY